MLLKCGGELLAILPAVDLLATLLVINLQATLHIEGAGVAHLDLPIEVEADHTLLTTVVGNHTHLITDVEDQTGADHTLPMIVDADPTLDQGLHTAGHQCTAVIGYTRLMTLGTIHLMTVITEEDITPGTTHPMTVIMEDNTAPGNTHWMTVIMNGSTATALYPGVCRQG